MLTRAPDAASRRNRQTFSDRRRASSSVRKRRAACSGLALNQRPAKYWGGNPLQQIWRRLHRAFLLLPYSAPLGVGDERIVAHIGQRGVVFRGEADDEKAQASLWVTQDFDVPRPLVLL